MGALFLDFFLTSANLSAVAACGSKQTKLSGTDAFKDDMDAAVALERGTETVTDMPEVLEGLGSDCLVLSEGIEDAIGGLNQK
jgi:hypothetical protein